MNSEWKVFDTSSDVLRLIVVNENRLITALLLTTPIKLRSWNEKAKGTESPVRAPLEQISS